MPRYLWQVSYTVGGLEGVLKEGGTRRRQTVQQLVEGLGGRLELFDYALGDDNAFIVAQLPNNVSALTVSMVVNAAGGATLKTSVLVTPEELEQAAGKRNAYVPPRA